jgi:hypothetical protein
MVSAVKNIGKQSQSTEINSEQVAAFLKQHEEVEMIIPVLFGLFFTSRLQLRGANALFVNLAVASIFRQVFKQLKQTTAAIAGNQQKPQTTNASLFGEGVEIVHSVPGRVRLKILQLADDPAFAKRLERLLNSDDSVISVRINRLANSVVINYDSESNSELNLGLKLMSILNAAQRENVHE